MSLIVDDEDHLLRALIDNGVSSNDEGEQQEYLFTSSKPLSSSMTLLAKIISPNH
jgi:hypothetical protein